MTAERRNYYRNQRVETLEDQVLYELRGGIPQFKDYLKNRVPRWGIDQEAIAKAVRTERARRILVTNLDSLIRNYHCNGALYLEEVKKVGRIGGRYK